MPNNRRTTKSMIRDAVIAERDRRGWSTNELAQRSGVPQSRLHAWLSAPGKSISSRHVDTLMKTLGLTIVATAPGRK